MDLNGVNFTANGNQVMGEVGERDVILSASGTWGSGSLTVELYNSSLAAYLPIAKYSADSYKQLSVGKGAKMRLTLAGATSPDLDVGLFEVR